MSEHTEKGFFENLWERRFIQYLVSYLVASWGILQFTEWITKRYALPNAWVDLIMIFLLTLIPSVLLVTYNQGKPGKDRWRMIEKIAIPANVIIAASLVFILFSGQSLQAMASKVTVTNEDGDTIERLVAKGDAVQKIALFNFLNKTAKEENNWLTSALPILLSADLEQDIRFYCEPAFELKDEIEAFDYRYDQELPYAVKLKVAEENYKTQFLEGEILQENQEWILHIKVFEVEDGELFFEESFRGTDLLLLIDQIAELYLSKIENPEIQREEQPDLPVGDLFTANLQALQAFTEGEIATYVENNPNKAVQLYQQALNLDPNFIECHLSMGILLQRINQSDQAEQNLEYAMEHSEILTERQQFRIRHQYYLNAKNNEKAIALLEMWRQLYPNSLTPYKRLIQAHAVRADFEKARQVGEEALQAGHGKDILLNLAQLSLTQGKTEQAEGYFKQFAEAYPEKASKTTGLAKMYHQQGDNEKALEYLEQLLLLQPNDPEVLMALAEILMKTGHFEEAENKFLKAHQKAKTFNDSIIATRNLVVLYHQIGHINQSIASLESLVENLKTRMTPFEASLNYLNYFTISVFADGGRIQDIKTKINEILTTYPDPQGIYPCAAQINLAIAEKNRENINQIMADCTEELTLLGGENMMVQLKAYQYWYNEEYEQAIESFTTFFTSIGLEDPSYYTILAELYRQSGNPEKGLELLAPALERTPFVAEYHYMNGKCLLNAGQTEAARKAITRALELWADADDNYVPAKEARADLAEIQ